MKLLKPKPYILLPEDDRDKMLELVKMVTTVGALLKKGRSECVYQNAILRELQLRGIQHTSEESLPLTYKGAFIGLTRADILLYSWFQIVIELKATTTELFHYQFFQTIGYMRQKGYCYGMLVNFNQSFTGKIEIWFIMLIDDKPYKLNPADFSYVALRDYNF